MNSSDKGALRPTYGRRSPLSGSSSSGVYRGRIEASSPSAVLLRRETDCLQISMKTAHTLCRGDIAEIEACLEGGDLLARDYRVLVRPTEDPTDHPESIYRRLGSKRKALSARSRLVAGTRAFFLERGFIEISTPTLVPSPGMEANLAGFETSYFDHEGGRHCMWLPTSPEFALKKALCAGMERVFDIRQVFRNNGEVGPLHQPEFTMLEWYRAYENYRKIMVDAEELVAYLAEVLGEYRADTFRGMPVSWSPPYSRISVSEALDRYAGIDLLACMIDEELFRISCTTALGRALPADEDFTSLFCRIMMERVEPHLGTAKPVFLYDYPAELAALATLKPDEPRLAERFELYVAGVEMANAFTELNDPREMARRIRKARKEQSLAGRPVSAVDGELLRSMRQGMPPAGGIAFGLDRLLMAFLNADRISDVLAFPMRVRSAEGQRLGSLR